MGKRGMRRTLAGIVLAAGLLFVPSASAVADTAVMGSTLTGTFDGGVSGAPVLSVQLSYDPATSPNPVVAPADGTITGWKVKSADDGAIYTLKILRPNGPVNLQTATTSNFTGVASVQAPSAVPVGTGATTPTGEIFSYPASLPISKGDYVGVALGGAADGLPQAFTNGVPRTSSRTIFRASPRTAVRRTFSQTSSTISCCRRRSNSRRWAVRPARPARPRRSARKRRSTARPTPRRRSARKRSDLIGAPGGQPE